MSVETVTPSEIAAEIERLRVNFPDTQDLYREVCVLLFFRHGVTPTANKLYQLVRKGSMSTPTVALRTFWEDLREKSRIRIEHPDLPETIRDAAGEMVAVLWKQAQMAANENLTALQDSAAKSVLVAQQAQQAMEEEYSRLQKALSQSQGECAAAQQSVSHLERQLAAEKTGNESSLVQLEKSASRVQPTYV